MTNQPTDEEREVDLLTWTVIPALPGTRIEWQADWCDKGSLPVHAWLIQVDVIGRRYQHIDISCVTGYPMVLNANDELQAADQANLEGTPGRVIEP